MGGYTYNSDLEHRHVTTCNDANVISSFNKRRGKRKRQTSSTINNYCNRSSRLISILAILNNYTNLPPTVVVQAHNNFCGTTWGDASDNCISRQPCPLGTNDECSVPGQQCWADTSCDTSLGHGILYDTNDPTHTRFCGSSWEDASNNCSVERHCPSGDDSDCPGEQTCYLHLSQKCHYVDLLGGPEGAAAALSGGGNSNGGGGSQKLDGDHPSRSNYCGWDWNGANKCDMPCLSGSDADCPAGKTCFAGTECKYIDDLQPTVTPTEVPSYSPTPAPVIYNTIENTSFCAKLWGDTQNTCRIGSHCPSGDDNACPSGQKCFTWISGCNILDFKNHLEETGQEIFGAAHWLLPEGGLPGEEDVVSGGANGDSGSSAQLPPSEMMESLGLTPPSEVQSPAENNNEASSSAPPVAPPEPTTLQPTKLPTTYTPTVYDPNKYVAENHVFCGKTHADATERCSPETFCSDGAGLHQCDDVGDYCWAGVTKCNAGQWNRPGATLAPSEGEEEDSDSTAMPTPMWSTQPELPTAPEQIDEVAGQQTTNNEDDGDDTGEMNIVRQSFCAVDYAELMANCAILRTCNRWQPCPSGYSCFSNVKCLMPKEDTTTAAPTPVSIATSSPTFPPITMSPIAKPVSTPTTTSPTPQPTIFKLSDEEVEQRLSNMNNYCASSFSEVMSSCSYALQTCNVDDRVICPSGTVCFENLLCPNPQADTVAPVASSKSETGAPTLTPISYITPFVTTAPTLPPTKMPQTAQPTSKPSTVARVTTPQNYCTTSETELQTTCTTAQTCNDGEGLCPFGMYCLKNYLCSNNEESSSIVAATSDTVTSSNSKTQNYCAQYAEELDIMCDWAPTCNDGDDPCPPDTYCFPNVVCESRPEPETTSPTSNPVSLPPTMGPTPTLINGVDSVVDQISETDSACICLQAIGPSDCGYIETIGGIDNVVPCTVSSSQVKTGDLCIGTGECGTDLGLNNCADGHDVYFRLDSSKCLEHGFVNGHGVIPPPNSEKADDQEVQTNEDSSDTIGVKDNETATEDELSNTNSTSISDISWEDWPTEEELEEEAFTDNVDHGLEGWWLIKESQATRGANGGLKNIVLALGLGLMSIYDL